MAIGQQPSADTLNAEITTVAQQWRGTARAAQDLSQKIVKMGTAGLTAGPPDGPGLSPADADSALSYAGYLATLGGVFYGTAEQTPPFNFDDEFGTLKVYGQ